MKLKERLYKLLGKGHSNVAVAHDSANGAAPGPPPEMAPLPAGWGETLTGEPMPNVVAAVRRSRENH